MKALRILCNIALILVICIALSVLQVVLFDLLAAQSKDTHAIHIFSNDDQVGYTDSFSFYFTDIKNNFQVGPKYRIRNWSNAGWWKKGMAWADYALDAVIGVVKPIFVPIAQVNAVMDYTNREISDFTDYLKTIYKDERSINNALYEVYVLYEKGYGKAYIVEYDLETRDLQPTRKPISTWDYTGDENTNKEELTEIDYAKWVRGNKALHNTIWKLTKYNGDDYKRYFTKFIAEKDGVRYINSATIVLFYQGVVSLICAIIFDLKYPIAFTQGRFVGSSKGRKRKGIISSDGKL